MLSKWLLTCDVDTDDYAREIEALDIADLKVEAKWFALTRPSSAPGQTVTVMCRCTTEGDYLCDLETVVVNIPDSVHQQYIHDIALLVSNKLHPRGSSLAARFEYFLHHMNFNDLDTLRSMLVACSVKDTD